MAEGVEKYFEDGWHWVEKHPWWTAGGIVVIGGIVIVLWSHGSSSGSSNPGTTFAQQMAWQKLTGNQQLAAIRAQEAPSIASVNAQKAAALSGNRSATAQARIAAGASVATTRLGIGGQDYANNLQYKLGAGQLAFQESSLPQILAAQQEQQQAQYQNQSYLAYLASYVEMVMNGVGIPGYGGPANPLPVTTYPFPYQ